MNQEVNGSKSSKFYEIQFLFAIWRQYFGIYEKTEQPNYFKITNKTQENTSSTRCDIIELNKHSNILNQGVNWIKIAKISLKSYFLSFSDNIVGYIRKLHSNITSKYLLTHKDIIFHLNAT